MVVGLGQPAGWQDALLLLLPALFADLPLHVSAGSHLEMERKILGAWQRILPCQFIGGFIATLDIFSKPCNGFRKNMKLSGTQIKGGSEFSCPIHVQMI